MSLPPCEEVPTNTEKTWLYHEYFIGQKDKEERKTGHGEHHWTGAKSLEWYDGHLLRDTMHGPGEYRWRHLGQEGLHFTYEGCFYCNRMHGFGTMSYPDGKVFTGLFHNNIRWGPGTESTACLKQDVGLWRGTQLVRLAWRPLAPSIAPDFCTNALGRATVDPHRVMLSTNFKTVGETNSAIDLLKQYGSDPMSATERWERLYPKNCTDLASLLCHVKVFEREYYKDKIHLLEEVSYVPDFVEDITQNDEEDRPQTFTYFAWNNNRAMVHMMKHSYTHDHQRNTSDVNLTDILSGPRQLFKPAGKHEIDCRTLLMACFLGRVCNVAQLVNEQGVHPDIADCLGNSAVMYATCGDQADLIHFLVEAGANVDSYNDSCCTPLGIALLRLACIQKDIFPSGMVQAVLPPPIIPAPPLVEPKVVEWHIVRDQPLTISTDGVPKVPSKINKSLSTKRIKSVHSLKDLGGKKKTEGTTVKIPIAINLDESVTEFRLYHIVHTEFSIRINDLYFSPSAINPIPYLFEVNDMIREIEGPTDDHKKLPDKAPKSVPSKVMKNITKPSRDTMWQTTDKDDSSIDSVEKQKQEMISRIMLIILQLLEDGANPKLVRCPQPALFVATITESSNLVKHLVNYGADINEVYHETFGYTPLDLAISRPLSFESLEVIQSILECGGNPNHRLQYGEISSYDSMPPEWYGPTLYHAILAKKTENETQDDIKLHILESLLDHNCHPLVQFKGQSAVDVAMTKNMTILDVFIKSPITNLNGIINEENQTILVKMFTLAFFKTVPSAERLQTLTNLLLFGADPLLECRNGDESYQNLFAYAKKVLTDLESSQIKPTPTASPSNKADSKKEKEKPKKEPLAAKSTGLAAKSTGMAAKSSAKMAVDDIADYKQAVDLVVECARILHVRWLQAKVMKEIVAIIDKYKHRQWNMIMQEHKHKKSARLWLTPERCLEIWDIMKTTKRKIYNDTRILKHLLYIVSYYNSKTKILASTKLTAEEKYFIEIRVSRMLKERKMSPKLSTDMVTWKRPYVKPELTSKLVDRKFNVCFECAIPLDEEKIECISCKLVSFCCLECMKINCERGNCHPCNDYLILKYFPSPPESLDSKYY